jgi:SAM-dependent methyltransferase
MEKWKGKVERPLRIYVNPKLSDDIYLHFSELKEAVEKYSDKIKGITLDVGAGKSPYRSFFKNSAKYIRLDKFDYGTKPDIIGDATKIKLKNNSVDSVVCFQVLEHLQEPQKAVDEMYRVLKKGGVCLLTTHMATVLHGEPHDYFRFTKYALKDVLFRKFSEVKVEPNGGALLAITQLIVWGLNERLPKIIASPLTVAFNFLGKKLDKIFFSDVFTLNYIVYARK